jgi:hypothetical protein
MDCTIKTKDLESRLHCFAGIRQPTGDSQCVVFRANEERLQIEMHASDAILLFFLNGSNSYRHRHSGDGTVDLLPLRKAFASLRDKGILRLHTDGDFLHLEDLKGNGRISLAQRNVSVAQPVLPPENGTGVPVNCKHLLRGIRKVAYAADEWCASPRYEKLCLLVSKDRLTFIGGNGNRFATFQIYGQNGFSGGAERTVYLPKPVLRPLVKSLQASITDTVILHSRTDKETEPVGPSLLVEGGDCRLYGTCPPGEYPDVMKVLRGSLPFSASMRLSSWTPVVQQLRDCCRDRRCSIHKTRLIFDFSKGTVAVALDDVATPFDTILPLEAGCIAPEDSGQSTAILQCYSKYLLDIYDSSDETGTFSIRFSDFRTCDGTKNLHWHVEWPKQNLEEGVVAKYELLSMQPYGWSDLSVSKVHEVLRTHDLWDAWFHNPRILSFLR